MVAELRALQEDQRLSCEALSGRLDLLRERLFWLLLETLRSGERTAVSNEKLTTLVERLEGLCTEPSPCQVTNKGTAAVADPGSQEALSEVRLAAEEIREATEVGTEVFNTGVWVLVGTLLGLLVIAMLWRAFHGR